jgi:phage terminase small subunit
MATKKKKLTPKQQAFCDLYLIGLNAQDAYIQCYKTNNKNTAKSKAHHLLNKEYIKEYIEKRQQEVAKKTEVTIERVVNELAKLGFSNVKDLYTEDGRLLQPHELSRDVASAIQEITIREEIRGDEKVAEIIKYKLADKKGSLDLLMKHLGGYDKDNKQKITEIKIITE